MKTQQTSVRQSVEGRVVRHEINGVDGTTIIVTSARGDEFHELIVSAIESAQTTNSHSSAKK